MKENKIWLATGNNHKVKEARVVLAEYGIERDDRRVSFYRLLYDLVS